MTRQISISMFNVGFGDCFLVEIPIGSKTRRILFDCGRHQGSSQELANEVIEAVTDGDKVPRIDLVVATHRHKDHVNGFGADGWDKVEVAEVWMPWTEQPDDPKARGLAARQIAAATQALKALRLAAAAGTDADGKMAGLVGLALSNEAAMDTLYHGFAGEPKRRYLPDRASPMTPLSLPSLPGVRFHVMGPPLAEAAMGTMDPPKAETFRKLAMMADEGGGGALIPFGTRWQGCSQTNPLFGAEDQAKVQAMSSGAGLEGLAALIDNAINNTSLVIMVEIGSAFLLFCADAQWGNWQSILAESHWKDLIRKTTFLKVGHHASHNASPVTLINELLPPDIPAMVSVVTKAYNNVPYQGLLDAFTNRRFNVARSDEPDKAAGYQANDKVITLQVPF